VTVRRDGERLKPHAFTDAERAELAAKAWHWHETEMLSTRSIAARILEREGIRVSHVWVAKALNEAREQAKILELYGSAQTRAGQIGRFEQYLENMHAAVQANDIPFDVGYKLILQTETLLTKITGSAAATKVEVTERAAPNMMLLEELRKAADHAKRTRDMEENDGLDAQ
jgi:hypothetical protein